MTAPPIIPIRVTPDDAEYQRLSAKEAAYWASVEEGFLEKVEARADNTPIERHTNTRFTGRENLRWYETIADRGPFRNGLVLGTSGMGQDARMLEMMPGLRLTFCDIAEASLQRWQQVLGAKFPGRIETRIEDLNFVELPPDTYDLVVSSSTLHHIINLEHVAQQVNRTLTPDGIFALQDCVCENRLQFDERKKRIFELLYNRDIARHKGRRPGVIWHNEDPAKFSPFCGIRSGDILEVMAREMHQVELHTATPISSLLVYATPADGVKIGMMDRVRSAISRRVRKLPVLRRLPQPMLLSPALVEDLLLADDILSDSGVFKPFNAFAIYRKRM